ncbi:uncharacterized protein LOC130736999 [Lotus japonicus]|uniref:uncharacterized protein LOC130736999 n=1 Tax=Lotus japonicus TaxID=34305 RepID=UPI0025881E48|nr:uncharacterized protein LOC130736999 [Lotus japonicus]
MGNSKALNAIFNGVDKNMFRLINTCTVAKEAWDILKTAHEGTARVRMSRLQMLTTQFENLRMTEEETISEFHMRVRDLANSSFALGEPMSDEKLVRKILRSLPKKFAMKVTAIEEAQDIGSMKVDELIGSLQTGNLSEALALLGRKFNRALRKIDKKSKTNVQDMRFDNPRSANFQRKAREDEKSDEDTDEEDEITANKVTAFSGTIDESDSSDEEITDEELAETYRLLHNKWKEACEHVREQESEIKQLTTQNEKLCEIGRKLKDELNDWKSKLEDIDTLEKVKLMKINAELEDEIASLKNKLETTHKSLRMLNNGSDMLDEILKETRKQGRSLKGIGFDYKTANKEGHKSPKKFVSAVKQSEFNKPIIKLMSDPMSQHVPQHVTTQYRNVRSAPWRCHYCGRNGHIRPYCFKLYGYPQISSLPRSSENTQVKRRWIPKGEVSSLIAHTSFRVSSREDWYFDSGFSRHMTGDKSYLENIRGHTSSYVTFGDGAKGKIKGIGRLVGYESPNLTDVLLVKGLTANLISISQLCDKGLDVKFSKTECVVTKDDEEVVMRGVRSKDNCYMWISEEKSHFSRCLLSKEDELNLWHQRLGHLNLKSMQKVITEEAIRGLPKLKLGEGRVCGECQIGKQTKMSHKMLQHQTTTKLLELLHMDLMGPMQVESLGGKRYVFVCVDDFSRYTWVDFIREKSDTFEIFKNLCLKLQNEKGSAIVRIRSDHGKEFENSKFSEFCGSEGTSATQYELWKGRKPTVKYFHVFGSKCYVLADREQRRKLDPKSDVGLFMGYSTNSSAYRVYNLRTKTMMESFNVIVDDQPSEAQENVLVEDEDVTEGADVPADDLNIEPESWKLIQKIHPQENIIGDLHEGVITRSRNFIAHACFISKLEPKNVNEALTDEYWINAMQEELDQFRSADDRKSTSGGCFFLGNNLISWFSKKQNCVSLSTAEAEYIAAGSSCTQLMWMKQMLKEYDVEQDAMALYCDNLSAINISKNPIQHSRTKHIDIRHHFIRDLVEDKIITLEHVTTEKQLADIFTKPLDACTFEKLRGSLGICLSESL